MNSDFYSRINRSFGFFALTCLSAFLFLGIGMNQLHAQCTVNAGPFNVSVDANASGVGFLNSTQLNSAGAGVDAGCDFIRYYDAPVGGNLLYTEEIGVDPGLARSCGIYEIYFEVDSTAAFDNPSDRELVNFTVNDPVLTLPAAGIYDVTYDCGVNPAVPVNYLQSLQNTIRDDSDSNCDDIDVFWISGAADTISNTCDGTPQRVVVIEHLFEVTNNHGVLDSYYVQLTYEDDEAPEWDVPPASPGMSVSYDPVLNELFVTLDCNDPNFSSDSTFWQNFIPSASDNCNQDSVVVIEVFNSVYPAPPLSCPLYEINEIRWEATDGCVSQPSDFGLFIQYFDNTDPVVTSAPTDTVDVFTNPPGDPNCEFDFATTGLLEITVSDCQATSSTWNIVILTGGGSASPSSGPGTNAEPVLTEGEYELTYFINDGCNFIDTSIYIRVINNNGLNVTCPSNIGPIPFLLNECFNTATWDRPEVTGFCLGVYEDYFVEATIVNLTNGDSSNSVVDPIDPDPDGASANVSEGEWEVVYYFEDGLGDPYTCSFTITVEDDRAAEFSSCTTPSDIAACDSTTVPDLVPALECAASVDSVVQTPAAGTLLVDVPGLTVDENESFVVTIIAYSLFSTDTCERTVTLGPANSGPTPNVDSLPAINPDNLLAAGCGVINIARPTATSCSGETIYGVGSDGGIDGSDTTRWIINADFGPANLVWTYTDGLSSSDQSQSIHVTNDIRDPEVNCPAGITVDTDPGVCDATGLSGIGLTFVDPALSFPPYPPSLSPGEYSDDCDAPPAVTFQIDGGAVTAGTDAGVSTFELGNNTVTYEVEDSEGNTASCAFTVTVEDNENPNINNCPTDQILFTGTLGDPAGDCIFTFTGTQFDLLMADVDDNCGVETIEWSQISASGLLMSSMSGTSLDGVEADLFAAGTGTVTLRWTVTDSSSNTTICDVDYLIFDVENPEITCPGNTTLSYTADGDVVENCFYTASGGEFDFTTVDDNCATNTPTYEITGATSAMGSGTINGVELSIGDNDVTWTVTDIQGNTDDCSFTVTVTDDERPHIDFTTSQECGDTINVVSTAVECNPPISWEQPILDLSLFECSTLSQATRNFVGAGVNGPAPAYDVNNDILAYVSAEFELGTTDIVYYFEDANGNDTTCQITVVVADETAPQLTACAGAIDLNSICDNVPIGDLTANANFTDNCIGFTVFQDPPSSTTRIAANGGTPLNDGDQITVSIWAEDASGNVSDTCELVVTFNANDNPVPNVNPLPTLDPDDILSIGCGEVELPAYTATNCNGDLILGVPSGGGLITDVNGDSTLWRIESTTPVTITWTYNHAGNTTTQFQDILFEDNERDPQVECYVNQNYEVVAGECTVNPESLFADSLNFSFVSPTAPYGSMVLDAGEYTDICDVSPEVTYEISGATSIGPVVGTNPGAEDYNVGVNTVTMTVTDDQGQDASCSFTVTVEDNLAPLFTICPGNQAVITDVDTCFATVNGIGVVVDENCEIDSISYEITGITSGSGLNDASGTEFNVGSSTVTYTAVDTSGNFSTCQFTVNVTDNQNPDITCATLAAAYDTDPGECDFAVSGTGFDPAVDDNCGVAGITNNYNASSSLDGATFPLGSTAVVWEVTDVNGNTNTCQISVNVEDNELPVINCNANDTLNISTNDCFRSLDIPVDVSDNCGVDSTTFSVTADNGTQINPGGGAILKSDIGNNWFFQVELNQGLTTFSYNIQDENGNTSLDCDFTLFLADTIPPSLDACDATATVTSICDSTALPSFFGNATINDNCAPLNFFQNPAAGMNLIDANGGVSLNDGDDIVVQVWAEDNSGNLSDTCDVTVTFNASDNPVAAIDSLMPVNPGNTLEAGCGPLVILAPIATTCNGDTLYGETGGAGITDLMSNPPSYSFNNFNGNVIWNYDDGAGNTSSQSQDIQVTSDTAAPVVVCPVNLTVDTDSGVCEAVPNNTMGVDVSMTYVDPTSFFPPYPPSPGLNPGEFSDNCDSNPTVEFEFSGATTFGPATILNDDPGTETFNEGVTTVSVTVTDVDNNTANCTYTITVEDNEDPVYNNCPVSPVVIDITDPNAPCGTDYSFSPDVDDNCGISELNYLIAGDLVVSDSGDINNVFLAVGDYTITFIVEDTNGNTSTCNYDVDVNDLVDPVVDCPFTTMTFDTDAGQCHYTATSAEDATATDSCGIASLVHDYNGGGSSLAGEIFPLGSTDVTWTATDVNGNVSTCMMTVVVEDNEAPTITCNPNDTITVGACELASQDFPIDVFENCELDLSGFTNSSIDNGGSFDLGGGSEIKVDGGGNLFFEANLLSGLTTISYSVSDTAGNESASCSFTVLLLENSATTVTCQPNPSVDLDSNGEANIPLNLVYSSHDGFCPNPTIVHNPTSVDCTDSTSVDVTVVVSDNAGNIDSCTTTVLINDNIDPVAACVDTLDVFLDGSGDVSITTGDIDDGSDDNTAPLCALDLSLDVTDFDCSNVGNNTVVLSVEDSYNNVSTCEATVNVIDNEIPSITCPSDINENTDTGVCTYNLASLAPISVDDNCGVDSVGYEISGVTSGSGESPLTNIDFNNGVSTVVFTVVDVNGNTNSCSVTVTVTDIEVPMANSGICGQLDTVDTDPGVCTADISYDYVTDGWFSDNCTSIENLFYTTVITNPGGSMDTIFGGDETFTFQVGTSTIEVFAQDAAGNVSAGCMDTIVVEDNELPVPGCPPGDTVSIVSAGGSCTPSWQFLIEPTDNCGIDFSSFNIDLDTSGSVITPDVPAAIQAGNNVFFEFDAGNTNVTFTVTDVNGNVDSCDFVVNVTTGTNDLDVDCSDPDVNVYLGPSGIHTFSRFNDDVINFVTNNCGTWNDFYDPAFVDCSDFGAPVQVEVTVVDQAGNSATCMTNVNVLDTIPPVASCVSSPLVVELDSAGTASITTSDIDAGSTDNTSCDLDLSLNVDMFDCSDLGPVDVWLTAVDTFGNEDSCLVNVEVVDLINPVILCPDSDTVNTDLNLCTANVMGIQPDSTFENCTIDSITYNFTGVTSGSGMNDASGTDFELGVTTVTYTIYDDSQNSSTCSFDVTVEDNQAPEITCATQDTIVGTSEDGMSGDCVFSIGAANEAGFSASATDNCAMPPLVTHNISGLASNASLNGFDAPLGNTTIVWTADDGNGNTASCSFVLTVEDDEVPFAGCPSDVSITNAAGCTATRNIAVNADDNCAVDYTTFDLSFDNAEAALTDGITPVGDQAQTGQFEIQFPAGETVVTYFVEDESGNSHECSFTVTVTEGTNNGELQCLDNQIFELNSNGVHEFVETDLVGNYLNYCDSITTVFDPPVLNCSFGTGTSVTIIAFDNAGNDDTCTVTVQIEDNIDPVSECLATLDVFLDVNGQATLDSNALDNGSFDNTTLSTPFCDIEFEIEQSAFDCSHLGTSSIWQVVTDVYDNTDTCFTSVTVLDTLNPIFTCPSTVIQDNDIDDCGAVVSNIEPLGVSDNCTITDTTYTLSGDLIGSGTGDVSGTFFPVGTTNVVYTISDQSGNTSSCDFDVTIEDVQSPDIVCAITDSLVTTSGDGNPGDCVYTVIGSEFDATATDNCEVDTVYNDLNGTGTLAGEDLGLGTHNIRWYAVDIYGNIDSCDIVVEVEDDELPDPGCPLSTIQISANCNTNHFLPIDPFDNCGIDTSGFSINISNTGSLVTDTAVTSLGDQIYVGNGSTTGIYVNLNGGTTILTLTATDVNGLVNTCQFMVDVQEANNDGDLTCVTPFSVHLDDNGEYGFEVDELRGSISGFCSPITYTITPDTVDCVDRDVVNIELKAEDDAGNVDSCTVNVTVLDTIPPNALCQDTTIYLDEFGMASIDSSFVDDGSNDNADLCGLSVVLDVTEFDCSDVGGNPVVLTVTDVFNNVSTCGATVTVVDSIAPTIECVASPVSQNNDLDSCGAVVNNIGLITATDNCDIDTVEYALTGATTAAGGDDASGEFFNVGTTTVTYTVTDVNGNVSVCSFDVIITDNQVPDITSPFSTGDTLVFTSGDNVTYECFYQVIATEFDATATDNCQVDSVWNDWNNTSTLVGEQFAPGSYDIRWYAVDIYGNIDSIDTEVTVEDDEDPMVTCVADVDLNANSGCDASRQFNIGFEDNCAIDATSFEYFTDNPDVNEVSVNNLTVNGVEVTLEFPVGTTTVGWVVQDIYGNADTCYTEVSVTTTNGPIANCVDNFTAIVDTNGEYSPRPEDLLTNYTPGGSSCGIDTVFFSPDVLDCTDRPVTDVTVTVMDVAGLTDVCVVPVTITDTIPPVAVCQDTTIYLDEFGNYTIDSSYINNVSTDNADLCGLTMDLSRTAFDCDDISTNPNPVTLYVYDVFNNVDSCVGNVTVLDTVPPVVECPLDVVQNNDSGDCGAIVDNIGLIADDNCEVDFWTYTLSGVTTGSGSGDADSTFFVAGTTTVTYTATDVNNNTASCSFNVTVNDVEPPEIVCIGDTTVTTSGDGLADYDCLYVTQGSEFDLVSVTDNCLVDSVWHSIAGAPLPGTLAGVEFEAGTHNITWYAQDTSGNIDSCDFSITVVDDQAPQLSNCPVNDTVQSAGNCGTNYSWNIPDSIDNCEIETMIVYSPDRPGFLINTIDPDQHNATFPVGNTTIEYILTDTTGNADSCSFVVTVTGNPGAQQGPEITCQSTPYVVHLNGDGEFEIDTATFGEYGVSVIPGECAISNKWVGQDVIDCADESQAIVTFYVNDLAGNIDSCDKTFTVFDTIAPVAMCFDTTIYLDSNGFIMIDESYTNNGSSDNADACGLDFDLSRSTFNCNDLFVPVSVTMTVTDSYDNEDECTSMITVVDTVAPVVTCPTPMASYDNDNGFCGAEITDLGLMASDACGVETISYSSNGATILSGTGNVSGQFFNVGTTTVTYTAEDESGNSSSCSFDVVVNDTENPVVECPVNQVRGTGEDNLGLYDCAYTTDGSEFDIVSSSDNCGIDTFYHNIAGAASPQSLDGEIFGEGFTSVSWTVVDEAGNPNTCTFTVEVVDDENPDFVTCQADTTITSTLTSCDQLFVWDYPEVIDNCQLDSVDESAVDPNGNAIPISPNTTTSRQAMFPAGTSTVTYVATDATGNTSVCEFDVTVVNSGSGPTAICLLTPDVILDANGQAVIEPEDINPTYGSAGNCPLEDVYVTPSSINCSDLDEVVVTLTVVDASGMSDDCQVTLDVIDNIDPVAECDNFNAVLNANGTVTVDPSDIDGGSSDNCNIVFYELSNDGTNFVSDLTFTCSQLGPNAGVYLRVEDQSGNSSTCDATVTVIDNISPSISCPSDVTVNTSSAGNFDCVGSHNWNIPTPSDNCSFSAFTETVSGATNSGPVSVMGQGGSSTSANFNLGTSTVTYTVTDIGGNNTSCSFTVEVEDDEAPAISCPADQSFFTSEDGSGDCTFTYSGTVLDATASDNCSGIGALTNDFDGGTTLNGATFNEGETTVVWSVTDATGSNTNSCSFVITVTDDEAPAFTYCPSSVTIDVVGPGSCNNNHTWDAPMSGDIDDNCGIAEVTESVVSPSGPISITPTGYDPNDPSKTERTALFPIGTSEIIYTATDDSGIATTCSFTVTINENSAPNAICQDATLYLDAQGEAALDAEDIDNNSFDNCEIDTMYLDQSSFGCDDVGSNTVILTVVDFSGNDATCSATVTVLDTVAPVALCMDISVDLNSDGLVTVNADEVDANAGGNCSISDYDISTDGGNTYSSSVSFDCGDLGSNGVVLQITDDNGNQSTCTANIEVEDNDNPQVLCPGNATVNTSNNGEGDCTASFNWTVPTPSDNCDVDVLEAQLSGATVATFDQIGEEGTQATADFNLGVTTVTYLVEDQSGNAHSCVWTVTVEDDENPSLSGASSVNRTTSADNNTGDCMYTVSGSEFDPSSFSDNCGLTAVPVHSYNGPGVSSNTTLSGARFPVGTTNVNWSLTDNAGNFVQYTLTVEVEDDEPAEFLTCPSNIVVNASAFNCNQNASWQLPYAITDNCGVQSVTEEFSDPFINPTHNYDYFNQTGTTGLALFSAGITTVTYTATDVNGLTSTCEFTVTVNDNQAPIVNNCPDDATITALCSDTEIPSWLNNVNVTDNCAGNQDVTQSPAPGTLLSDIPGLDIEDGATFSVTVTATDLSPNYLSGSCTFTVTLENTDVPQPVVPGPLLPEMEAISCDGNSALVVAPTATVSDNCDGGNAVINGILVPLPAGVVNNGNGTYSFPNNFDQMVTWVYTNGPNETSQLQSITVVSDDTAPLALCNDVVSVNLSSAGMASINTAMINDGSSDDCGISSMSLDVTQFNCSDLGENTVTLTVEDQVGNQSSCTATVEVVDAVAPIAVCKMASVELGADETVTLTGADIDGGSSDNCGSITFSASPSTFDCSNIGVNNVTLTVTDGSGNTSSCSATVVVENNLAPALTCNDINVNLTGSNAVNIVFQMIAEATPACGSGFVSHLTQTQFDCSDAGANQVTVTVTDSENGQSAQCISTVNVIDAVDPVINNCPDPIVTCNANVNVPGIDATDNCGIETSSYELTGAVVGSGSGFGPIEDVTFPAGITNIVYTVEDVNGNTSSCETSVTIENDTEPAAICINDLNVNLGSSGSINISAEFFDASSFDPDCPETELDFEMSVNGGDNVGDFDFTCSHVGTNTIFLIAYDGAGNSGSCQTVLNVFDASTPEAVCSGGLNLALDENGEVEIDAEELDGGSSDNCFLTYSASQTLFDCSDIGVNNVILTVTDSGNNTSSCETTVTIEDDLPPVAVCADVTMNINNSGHALIIEPMDVDGGSHDNCGDVTMEIDNSVFTCSDVGDNPVVLTVTDNEGFTSTCEAILTVTCVEGIYTISGRIATEYDVNVSDVQVDLSGTYNAGQVTGGNGHYSFLVDAGHDVTVTPTKDINYLEGVTTLDLVQIQRHILQIEALGSPYKIIAGDANMDGNLSVIDLVLFINLIVGNIDELADNDSWRFVAEDYVFPDPQNPFDTIFPEIREYYDLAEDQKGEDWVAVKIGDVTEDITNTLEETESETRSIRNLYIQDRMLRKGELVNVPVEIHKMEQATGYQFGIEFDTEVLTYRNVALNTSELTNLFPANFSDRFAEDGVLRTNWFNANGVDFEDGMELMTLQFEVAEEVMLSQVLDIERERFNPEAYNNFGEVFNLNIEFVNPVVDADAFELFQNQPNPFGSQTTIGFILPNDMQVSIEIIDETGRLIRTYDQQGVEGYNQISVDAEGLSSGLYYYRLVSERYNAVKRMILQSK